MLLYILWSFISLFFYHISIYTFCSNVFESFHMCVWKIQKQSLTQSWHTLHARILLHTVFTMSKIYCAHKVKLSKMSRFTNLNINFVMYGDLLASYSGHAVSSHRNSAFAVHWRFLAFLRVLFGSLWPKSKKNRILRGHMRSTRLPTGRTNAKIQNMLRISGRFSFLKVPIWGGPLYWMRVNCVASA